MTITVVKQFEFEAAHYLPAYRGDCASLHGHTYRVQVGVAGPVHGHTGMVVDFKWLSGIVKDGLMPVLDHKCLNDVLPVPTAENLVMHIVTTLQTILSEQPAMGVRLVLVRVWETSTSYAEWRGASAGV